MKYIAFSSLIRQKKIYLLSFGDIKNLFSSEKEKTIKNNLHRWVTKGYLARLRQDLYEFTEQGIDHKFPDFYIANKLYKPSYISLETALSFYNIIPDVAAGVTSVTTLPTRTFKNRYGSFYYRTCTLRAFTGYRLIMYDGSKIQIADKEKSLVDFIYYRSRSGFLLNFEEERFNKNVLKKFNWRKALYYAGLFNKKTKETIIKCREFL